MMIVKSIVFFPKKSRLISVYREYKNFLELRVRMQAAQTSGIVTPIATNSVISTGGDHAPKRVRQAHKAWRFLFG
jgi:hypothetical protein